MNLLTELREGLGISWSAIRANKMRAVLTTLGIVIGIVTVTLMGTAIHGLNAAFLTSVSAVGTTPSARLPSARYAAICSAAERGSA